ncbi:Hypothetical predicted protein [Cloeon dipterum]|uniref:BZIP domain-containing protein n=1 Tax=Cloeon dipterum TaxID=197152 RepID=A0A8S1DED9_9INSE|nr:Hypothetical predicted protein [Cloeon dipterum]
MMDTAMYDSVEVKKLSGGATGGVAASVHINAGNVAKLAALKQHQQQQQLLHFNNNNNNNNNNNGGGGELAEIGPQDVSLELQQLMEDSQFTDNIFSDILSNQNKYSQMSKMGSQDFAPHLSNKNNNNNTNTANLNHSHVPSPPSSGHSGCSSPSSPFNSRAALAYMPQPVHSGASYGNEASNVPAIKEEPVDPQDYRQCPGGGNAVPYASPPVGGGFSPAGLPYSSGSSIGSNSNGPVFTTLTSGNGLGGDGSHMHLSGLKGAGGFSQKSLRKHAATPNGTGKPMDKSSEEYRRRRERNNIAVRKSREKAKLRSRETEEKVKHLMNENNRLQKKIESLTEELSMLRSLFANVGSLPEHIHRDLDKHLLMLQQQHLGHG